MNTTKSSKDGQGFQMDGKLDGQSKNPRENRNNFSEKLDESSKAFEKGFEDIHSSVTDMYNKQLNLMTGFYNNFFNPMMGNNKGWNIGQGFSSNFFNGDLTKIFYNPLTEMSNAFPNPFLSSFDKMYKQMLSYNHNLLVAFTTQATGNNVNWSEISKKYLETVENRLEASKNVFNLLTEAYASKTSSSIEINKKAMEEISNQFNQVIKQNQNFWADMLESYQGKSKTAKEPTPAEAKEKANEPIIA